MTTRANITSFYSYKGGVGRSMALANAAVLLAKAGRRVLAIDFDLDAPGLHRYFPASTSREGKGLIDLFVALRAALLQAFPDEGSYHPERDSDLNTCRAIVRSLLDSPEYFHASEVNNLTIVFAGLFDDDYADRVHEFDWKEFYSEFSEVFDQLREELCARFDDVLLDSRTGITDLGGVTTVVLPDRLVVVFSPNEQSMHGAAAIARESFALQKAISPKDEPRPPLKILPLLSRVERSEVELRNHWIQRAADKFSSLFAELYDRHDIDFNRFFQELHVPYSTFYSFGERLAVLEREDSGFGSIASAYERFVRLLVLDDLAAWLDWNTPQRLAEHRALHVQVDAEFPLPPGMKFSKVTVLPPLRDWRDLRERPDDLALWSDATQAMDAAIQEAIDGLKGELHVFALLPYPAAALLGRRLDDLARGVQVAVYVSDGGQWRLFSPYAAHTNASVFQVEHRLSDDAAADDVLVVLEGVREIPKGAVDALAARLHAREVVVFRQRVRAFLEAPEQTSASALQLRGEMTQLQASHPTAVFHVIATAPAALLIELGRMLSPNVVRGLVVHPYDGTTGAYLDAPDVLSLARARTRGHREASGRSDAP